MADFDKQLIHTCPADFVRFALQRDDIENVEALDTEQPTVRRTDSLLHVCLGDGEEVLGHHEFQTTDSTDSPMLQRMAAYIGYYIGQYGMHRPRWDLTQRRVVDRVFGFPLESGLEGNYDGRIQRAGSGN